MTVLSALDQRGGFSVLLLLFFFSITAYSPGSVPTTDPHGAGTLLVPKAVDQISDNDSLNMHEELQYLHHCTGSEHKSK